MVGGTPVSEQLLLASGLHRLVEQFGTRLNAATSLQEAATIARDEGLRLWDTAVARAQGRPASAQADDPSREVSPADDDAAAGSDACKLDANTLDPYDDRPLYWARTAMSAMVRTFTSPHLSTQHQRFALLHLLDRASRGIDRALWADSDPSDTRVMVSGFDTFGLDDSVRNSNPSGAAALQLDGRYFDTPHGRVVVRAVVLPDPSCVLALTGRTSSPPSA